MFILSFVLCLLVCFTQVYCDYYDALVDEEIYADLDTSTDVYKNISAIQKCMYTSFLSSHLLITLYNMDIVIEAKNQPCYHNKDIHSARDYIHSTWKNEIPENVPLLVFPFCLESASLGNWLGTTTSQIRFVYL
jgi:hypothetical protein